MVNFPNADAGTRIEVARTPARRQQESAGIVTGAQTSPRLHALEIAASLGGGRSPVPPAVTKLEPTTPRMRLWPTILAALGLPETDARKVPAGVRTAGLDFRTSEAVCEALERTTVAQRGAVTDLAPPVHRPDVAALGPDPDTRRQQQIEAAVGHGAQPSSPRAELVPPPDGPPRVHREASPHIHAALLAVTIPALAAVLLSLI